MKTLYKNRLKKFAEHLQKIESHIEHGLIGEVTLVDYAGNVRIPYQVKYQEWIFEELPLIFDEWYYTKKFGNPMFEDSDEQEGTIAAAIDFFDLSPDQFCHLFDIEGFQLVNEYGGNFLNFESSGPDFARNILGLVKMKSS